MSGWSCAGRPSRTRPLSGAAAAAAADVDDDDGDDDDFVLAAVAAACVFESQQTVSPADAWTSVRTSPLKKDKKRC